MDACDSNLSPFVRVLRGVSRDHAPEPRIEFCKDLDIILTFRGLNRAQQTLTPYLLGSFFEVLSDAGANFNCKFLEIDVTSAFEFELWSTIANAAPAIKNIYYEQCGYKLPRLSAFQLKSLASVPEVIVRVDMLLYESDETSILETATSIHDARNVEFYTRDLEHFTYVAQRCKRLQRYALANFLGDIALLNGVVAKYMNVFDDSTSIKELLLCGRSLRSPTVVNLLREMSANKRRSDLRIGLYVAPSDPLIDSICATFALRYLESTGSNLLVVYNWHPKFSELNRASHAELLRRMESADKLVHGAWSMLREP